MEYPAQKYFKIAERYYKKPTNINEKINYRLSWIVKEATTTLLYKVPSKSTGKNFVRNIYMLLPVEFITKYFFKVFDP